MTKVSFCTFSFKRRFSVCCLRSSDHSALQHVTFVHGSRFSDIDIEIVSSKVTYSNPVCQNILFIK